MITRGLGTTPMTRGYGPLWIAIIITEIVKLVSRISRTIGLSSKL
jgi:hypothetical protein